MSTINYAHAAVALRRCFAKFDHVNALQARLERLMQAEYALDDPDILMLLADTGMGKSTFLRRFARSNPSVEHETFTEIPVVYAPMPPKCPLSMIPGAILQAMGSPLWNRGTADERTGQLLTLMRTCLVRIVILDEVNHFVDRGQERTHYLAGDWIKAFSSKAKRPVIAAGIPRARVLLKVNEQLADRTEIITIEPFGASGLCKNQIGTALGAFRKVLVSAGFHCDEFDDPGNGQRFAFATAGRLRGIRKLLVRAVELAGEKSSVRIDRAHLADAFVRVIYLGAADKRNPFITQKFDGRPLTLPGEPYAPRRQPKEEVDA
jgi:hypothetical protein